jgi:hypothetical protein
MRHVGRFVVKLGRLQSVKLTMAEFEALWAASDARHGAARALAQASSPSALALEPKASKPNCVPFQCETSERAPDRAHLCLRP